MAWIRTIGEDEAEGDLAEMYRRLVEPIVSSFLGGSMI